MVLLQALMPFFVVMLSYIIMREKYPLKVCPVIIQFK